MAVPAAPTLLRALNCGNGMVKLTWNKVATATGYKSFEDTVADNTFGDIDYGFVTSTAGVHSFTLKASNGEGDSALSNAISIIVSIDARKKLPVAGRTGYYHKGGTGVGKNVVYRP